MPRYSEKLAYYHADELARKVVIMAIRSIHSVAVVSALAIALASGACSSSDDQGGGGKGGSTGGNSGTGGGKGGSGGSGGTGGAPNGGQGGVAGGAPCDVTVSDTTYAAVSAAVAAATDGQKICVPAGSSSWSPTLTIDKAITLQAAGIGQTIITDDYTQSYLIEITEAATGSAKVAGFDFVVGAGPTNPSPACFIKVHYADNGKPVLITASKFSLVSETNALCFETNRGVIWSNVFQGKVEGSNCLNNAGVLRHKAAGLAASWTSPPTYGMDDTNGDQNLYFETNTATDVLEGVDVDDNARIVFRYNNWTNSVILHHGADTSGSGGRYSEIYNNTFVWDSSVKCASDLPTNVNAFIFNRGGSMQIHDNVIPDVSGQAWGDKSEISFIVESLRRNAGNYACWTQGYPAPHQAGWGYSTGAKQAGTSGVFQDLEPIYLWNNTGGGNYGSPGVLDYSPNECSATADSATTYVQKNREYYTNTPKPGYTPYTYPHPLTLTQ